MKVVVSAGGTGGHIYPALAIIEKIKEKDKNSEFLYVGTHNRMEKDLIPELGIKYEQLEIIGFNRKKLLSNFKTLSLFLKAKKKASKILKEFKPDIVIGCGGYVTAPVIYAASKLKIKTLIHEQNSVVGMSNKFLSKYADLIAVSFEATMKDFDQKKVVLTGNPCGEKSLKVKKAKKEEFGLDENKKLIVIVMGSLGSRTVNDKIVNMLDKFNQNYEILFVTGNSYYEKVKDMKTNKNIKIVPFVYEIPRVLKICDLLISRAGASTMSEIMALNVPTIFIPSPYVPNNHQYKNAMSLVEKNAALILEEKELIDDNLIKMVDDVLNNEKKYTEIKENLKDMGINDSMEKIYNEIIKLVK